MKDDPEFDDCACPPSDPMLGAAVILLLSAAVSIPIVAGVWIIYEIGKHVLGVWA